MADAFGVNPIHLGIIFIVNLQMGYLTPPVGMNLFLSAFRFNKPLMYCQICPPLFNSHSYGRTFGYLYTMAQFGHFRIT